MTLKEAICEGKSIGRRMARIARHFRWGRVTTLWAIIAVGVSALERMIEEGVFKDLEGK